MKSPIISIIIPCFNQGSFLDETLKSILEQTYTSWECLIIDDGSSDATAKIAQKWSENDRRFQYFYKENGGLSSARNFGLEKMTGDFVQFLDSDDYLDHEKFQLSIKAILQNPSTRIVISNFKMFENNPKNTIPPYCILNEEKFTLKNILYQWDISFTIPIHCGFFEKSLFYNFRFPEDLFAKEDWVMWVNCYKNSPETIFIDQPLALYRRNLNSMTMTKNLLPDTLKAIRLFKTILSDEDFKKLYENIISKYYNSTFQLKLDLMNLKNSNGFIFIYFIKKVLRKFKLLKPFRKILSCIMSFILFAKQ